MFEKIIRLFATRRELKRLAADVKYYRGKAEASEVSKTYYQKLVLERDMLWADRLLTANVKTYAIGDEAKSRTQPAALDTKARREMLEERYAAERERLRRHAAGAGFDESVADAEFARLKPEIDASLDAEFGFNH